MVEVPVTTRLAPRVKAEVPAVLKLPPIEVTTNPEVEAEPLMLRLPLMVVMDVMVLVPDPERVRLE